MNNKEYRDLNITSKIEKGLDQKSLNPCFFNGAEGGTRTRTAENDRGILRTSYVTVAQRFTCY